MSPAGPYACSRSLQRGSSSARAGGVAEEGATVVDGAASLAGESSVCPPAKRERPRAPRSLRRSSSIRCGARACRRASDRERPAVPQVVSEFGRGSWGGADLRRNSDRAPTSCVVLCRNSDDERRGWSMVGRNSDAERGRSAFFVGIRTRNEGGPRRSSEFRPRAPTAAGVTPAAWEKEACVSRLRGLAARRLMRADLFS